MQQHAGIWVALYAYTINQLMAKRVKILKNKNIQRKNIFVFCNEQQIDVMGK